MANRKLTPCGNSDANLRSQPALWHMIRKKTPDKDSCFACDSSSDRMELHEEWSSAENGDTVLMGLFWLCPLCHDKATGNASLDQRIRHLLNVVKHSGTRKIAGEWPLINDEQEILEIQGRDDYTPQGGRYSLRKIDEEPFIIDFGLNYEESRRKFHLNVKGSIRDSGIYQSVLMNLPEPSELGGEIQIDHFLRGVIPDEGLECYRTGIMYGPWYYRYYGDNFAFDFGLAYDAESDSLPDWEPFEEYTDKGIDDYIDSSYVVRDGVCLVLPKHADNGYSKEQVLHFCSLFVRKYGDLPPSTLFGPALRRRWGMATFDQNHPMREQKIPFTILAVRLLAHSILQNSGGFGEVRESLGLPRTHGQAGPLGHPYRKISNSRRCQCGKSTKNGILKHRDVCTIMSEIWERRLERNHVPSIIEDLNLDEFIQY